MAQLQSIRQALPSQAGLSTIGALLALPDSFAVLPHPLGGDAPLVLVVGSGGALLVSYGSLEDPQIAREVYAEQLSAAARTVAQRLGMERVETCLLQEGESFDLVRQRVLDMPQGNVSVPECVARLNGGHPAVRINQYQVVGLMEVEEGTKTYLAYDTLAQRPVVLTEIEGAQPEDERHALLREAKLTQQLKGPNVATIEQVIPRENAVYVISEWVEGARTLRQVLDEGGRSVDESLQWVIGICRALEAAHALGIVHRNIRPENVLITPDGVARVTRFGLAKKADMATRSTYDLRQMVRENPYAAPEFRLGSEGHHQVDGRVDIFAVGVLLYELLTGKMPAHLDERYWVPPREIRPELPVQVDSIVAKALRFDPQQRFSTVSALRSRLEGLCRPMQLPDNAMRYVDRQLVKRTRNSLIFAASDVKLQRPVALKKVLLDPALGVEERQRKLQVLLDEARLASQLTHPHIVSVYDYFIEDDDAYLVMEWLDGKTLRETLNEMGTLPPERVRAIGIQVGEALLYAHHQGITHRDIKPENLMDHRGQITLLDFGLATLKDQPEEETQRASGTARYMAPEQLTLSRPVDQRADIFSLGVLLYELLTHRYPYDAAQVMGGYRQAEKPMAPGELNPDTPPALDRLILKAIQVDPEERYASMDAMLRDMELMDTELVPAVRQDRPHIPWASLLGATVGGGVLAAIVVFAGSRFLPPREDAPVAPVLVQVTPSEEPSAAAEPSRPVVAVAQELVWMGQAVTADGVTVRVSGVEENRAKGRTALRVEVTNRSSDEVAFLNRTDRPDLIRVQDDLGMDYTPLVDTTSVPSELIRIDPGSRAQGVIHLDGLIDPKARQLAVELVESDGRRRAFPISLLRVGR